MPAILDPLRERDLALLFSAKAVSVAGDGIYVVALAWQVYALSNVPAALATVGLALSVPQVALFLLGGVLADRFERRRVLLVADGVRAVALTTLGALALSGALELWHVVVLVAFVGAGDALFYPAFSALLPELASGERLARANALDQLTRTVALRLVGPVLGGALVAGVGAGPAFVLDGLSFALSLLALSRIRRRPAPAAGHARRSVRTELAEGVRYVRGEAWLACTLALAALSLLLFWGPFEVLLPYVIRNDLGGGAGDFGAVLAAGGAGAVVATLWLAACYLAWGLMLSSLVGYGLVTATWQAAAVYAVAYGLNAIAVVIFSTKVQESVPRELLGRVSSLDWVTSYALIPLSFALTENARVDATVAALRAGDQAAVGSLLDASHASLRDLYDASVPAVEQARERMLEAGAAGARMMGGGFGGSVLALFPPGAQAPPEAIAVEPGLPARVLA